MRFCLISWHNMEGLANVVTIIMVLICSEKVYTESITCERMDNCCLEWDEITMGCTVCSPGYVGTNCTEICPYPGYGEECQSECRCEERLCDVATGCISDVDGCRSGYYGDRCLYRCRYPNYGKHCQRVCQCNSEDCHYITGCPLNEDTSYFLSETHAPKIDTKENPDDAMVNSVVISSIALGFVVVFGLVVMLAFCRVRKSTRDTHPLANTTTSQGNVCAVNHDRTYCDSKTAAEPSHVYVSTPRDPDQLTERCTNGPMQFRESTNTMVYPLSSHYYETVAYHPPGENGESRVMMENSSTSESNYNTITEDRSSYIKMEI